MVEIEGMNEMDIPTYLPTCLVTNDTLTHSLADLIVYLHGDSTAKLGTLLALLFFELSAGAASGKQLELWRWPNPWL